jgi:radical SAM superfamily enzyme YgiQ (UPF0313 family)
VDNLNTLFLTPLPGTRLWDQMKADNRIALDHFPEDWRHYTLTFPVARYKHLSMDDAIAEMRACNGEFYSLPRIMRRGLGNLWGRHQPLRSLVSNLACRGNVRLNYRRRLQASSGNRRRVEGPGRPLGEHRLDDSCRHTPPASAE